MGNKNQKTDTQKTIIWIVIILAVLMLIGGVAWYQYGGQIGAGGLGFGAGAGLTL